MPTKVPGQNQSNRLFLTIMSIMAGVQFVGGGIVLIDAIPPDLSGILLLVVGAVNASVMYYLNGNIVSLNNVVAYQPDKVNNPDLFAGGASTEPTGNMLPVDTPVGSLAERVILDDKSYPDGA